MRLMKRKRERGASALIFHKAHTGNAERALISSVFAFLRYFFVAFAVPSG